jgi:hypothetical protein
MDGIKNATEKKRIKIEIKTKDRKRVPVVLVVNVLQRIQNIIYSVGDHVKGNPYRPRGDYPKDIKEDCSLVFSDVKLGSITADLQISEVRTAIPGLPTYGELALDKTNKIIETISTLREPKQQLLGIINDEKRLNRIITDFNNIWPNEESNYDIYLTYSYKKHQFYPDRKPIIESLLYYPEEEYEIVVQGRLIEYSVDQKRKFEVDTPFGKKRGKYTVDIEDYVNDHMGEFVRARGMMSIENNKEIFEIKNENALERMSTFPIKDFFVKNKLLTFKQPINVEVEYSNEQYIFSEDNLKLLVVAKNVKEGFEGIKEELSHIWTNYVLAKERELSSDAIRFKKHLLSLVKEG